MSWGVVETQVLRLGLPLTAYSQAGTSLSLSTPESDSQYVLQSLHVEPQLKSCALCGQLWAGLL